MRQLGTTSAPTSAQLAQPSPTDIAQRLADDARALSKRLDDYAGPLDNDLEEDLVRLRRSAESVLTGDR